MICGNQVEPRVKRPDGIVAVRAFFVFNCNEKRNFVLINIEWEQINDKKNVDAGYNFKFTGVLGRTRR
ncbi:protein of unknown function [Oenococcus oeni]|nr:hypothetical protein OENI_20227 [Oenococcus oeni]SYW01351.1 hypothetical protein OENI_280012 [Oenococcus oeni]SYW02854.1 hypothetical protein OENI_430001 [Oenococcus oeni]SYW17561.1 hypothetical protein OENI_10229 [Oenococcus oeni]VDC14714.1 protein of unknown function [Oenococcus oeni]